MMTIDEYLDAALKAGNHPSDRQLSLALGHHGRSVSLYRTKRAWPDDLTMIKIAELAGFNPDQALMDLNIWRAKNSTVAETYKKIAASLSVAAISTVLLLPPLPVGQGTKAEQVTSATSELHIMRQ